MNYPPPPPGQPPHWSNQSDQQMGGSHDPWRQYSQSQQYPPPPMGDDDSTFSNNNGTNGNNINTANNSTRKRAAKRRVKHDLPGPAGNWFRTQNNTKRKQKKRSKSAAALLVDKKKGAVMVKKEKGLQKNDNSGGGKDQSINNVDQNNGSNNDTSDVHNNTQQSQQQQTQQIEDTEDNEDGIKSDPENIKPDPDDDTYGGGNKKQQQQQKQLFHDHSSHLHESSTWNTMCTTLSRIVPPSNLLLSSNTNAFSTYKHLLRSNIPKEEYALIYEIHEGLYDTNHVGPNSLETSDEGIIEGDNVDLLIPKTLVGYVASIQCHAHSDWTAVLVDEMHSVSNCSTSGSSGANGNESGSNNNIGKGIICWIEERIVKQHAAWIRPGAVWMLEGAKLALFASTINDDEEDVEQYDDSGNISNNTSGNMDVSQSTDNARSGTSIDRMILVGEESLVYAWTPEEAASTFSHEEFVALTERRLNLSLPEGCCDDDGIVNVGDYEEDGDDDLNDVVVVEKKTNVVYKPKEVIEIAEDGDSLAGQKQPVNETMTSASLQPHADAGKRSNSEGALAAVFTLDEDENDQQMNKEASIAQVTAASVSQAIQNNLSQRQGGDVSIGNGTSNTTVVVAGLTKSPKAIVAIPQTTATSVVKASENTQLSHREEEINVPIGSGMTQAAGENKVAERTTQNAQQEITIPIGSGIIQTRAASTPTKSPKAKGLGNQQKSRSTTMPQGTTTSAGQATQNDQEFSIPIGSGIIQTNYTTSAAHSAGDKNDRPTKSRLAVEVDSNHIIAPLNNQKSNEVSPRRKGHAIKAKQKKSGGSDPFGLSQFKAKAASARKTTTSTSNLDQTGRSSATHNPSFNGAFAPGFKPYSSAEKNAKPDDGAPTLSRQDTATHDSIPVHQESTKEAAAAPCLNPLATDKNTKPNNNVNNQKKSEKPASKPEGGNGNDLHSILDLTPPREVTRNTTSVEQPRPLSNEPVHTEVEKASHLTPRDQITKKQSPKFLDTGGSFDDMLDENDETSIEEPTISTSRPEAPAQPVADRLSNINTSTNPVVVSATATAQAASLFDALDDDDMDFLDED